MRVCNDLSEQDFITVNPRYKHTLGDEGCMIIGQDMLISRCLQHAPSVEDLITQVYPRERLLRAMYDP
jgi:hypothetical protein